MSKDDQLQLDGEITEVLPAGNFRVKLKDMDTVITCQKKGKMKQAHISVIMWDWVKVEPSLYDMSKGYIVFRYNQYPPVEKHTAQIININAPVNEDNTYSKAA